MKAMTKGELHKISKRIDELDLIMDMCDPDRDADVLDNCEAELDKIVKVLEKSERAARINESGLKLIIGGLK